MRWLARTTMIALFVSGTWTSTVRADADYCVADAEVRCGEAIPNPDIQDETTLDAATTPDASAPVTRTIGPPTFVNPFIQTAAPATTQADTPMPQSQPNPTQKLPPGPPNRFP